MVNEYKKNPKTDKSGIICAIPQKGLCPNKCEDCFFQSGRSYLEPLEDNLPNMPSLEEAEGRVVRVNDGNDSNVQRELVIESTKEYKDKFYNTALPRLDFPGPVVLTLNPGKMTDKNFYKIENPPKNLMFVRFRVNMWNIGMLDEAVAFYTSRGVPIVLTFMAYFKMDLPEMFQDSYMFRKRTLNSYWAIKTKSWENVMFMWERNNLVYSCGHVEGELGNTKCKHCGNCLREYFATKERMRND